MNCTRLVDLVNGIARRDFLRQATVMAAATAFAREMAGAAEPSAPVVKAIDTHTHFYDPTRPQGVPWPNKSDRLYRTVLPPEFVSLTAKHGVVGTVVIEASSWLEDNAWVLDLAKDHPIIVGFVGQLRLGTPEFAGQLKRFSANPLFRGVRLNGDAVARSLGQSAFEDDLKRLGDQELTLDLIGGASMLSNIPRVSKLTPKLRIVIDHLPFGNWDQNPETMREALKEIAALPNVYAKVSEVQRRVGGQLIVDAEVYRPRLDVLWELFGPDRAMYGSNWPVSDLIVSYDNVHRIVAHYFSGKDHQAAEKYFWKNSLAAYRWQARGAAAGLIR